MDNEEPTIKNTLKRAFRRADASKDERCPGESNLIQYCEGSLDEEHVERMENHLADCSTCRHIVIEFQKVNEVEAKAVEIEVPETVTQRSIDLVPEAPDAVQDRSALLEVPSPVDVILKLSKGVMTLLEKAVDVIPTMMQPAAVAIRSAEEAKRMGEGTEIFSFRKELGEIAADVEVVTAEMGRLNISVRLTDMAKGRPLDGLRVTLTDMEYELESTRTHDGLASFEDHDEQNYCIEIEVDKSSDPFKITLKIDNS